MAHYFIANDLARFVAIASPKCASSAVRSWFLQTAGLPRREWNAIARYMVDAQRQRELDTYPRILFVRDPLRRLVGFYWTWVVRDPREWGFLDDARERSLAGATFRELIEGIDAARRQGRELQHHLREQIAGVPAVRPVDHLALVERLDDEIAALNVRFGLSGYDQPYPRRAAIDPTIGEPVMDRRPDWFDLRRAPAYERFYDADLAAIARRCFVEDVALHASIPGARPLVAVAVVAPRMRVDHHP
ncbi:MAG: sulfotransferase family 2 domain-containing protein [Vicinamibacterales bacterium]